MIKIIKENYKSTNVLVRSIYSSEDDENSTRARELTSILNIPTNSSSKLKTAIETVINSYKNKGELIETEVIFIQEMVKNGAMSGVIFSHDLISAIKLIYNSKNNYVNGEIYDISAGDKMFIREITEILKGLTRGDKPILGSKIMQKSEGLKSYSSTHKLRDHLNCEAKVKLDNGLKEMISFRKNF